MVNVSPSVGTRVICYCASCQAFARFLGGTDILDPQGGSDILQVSPSHVRITDGADRLRAMRLTEKGLIRWYADCCKTPVGNTIGGGFPFIGVVQPFMAHDASGPSRDELIGPPAGRIWGEAAIGGCPPGVTARAPVKLLPKMAGKILSWWIGGKGAPNAFFDVKTKRPIVEPKVLTPAERAAI
jgi:hypothetical protein